MKQVQSNKNPYPPSARGRLILSLCLTGLLFFSTFTAPARAQFDQFEEITSRSFAVHYRTIDEFLPLAKALTSRKGIITENRTMEVMVVNDYPSYLDRIDSLLSRFDRPLHQVRITIQLVLGSLVPDEENAIRNPEIESILGGRYNFNRLEPVEKSIIITEESKQTFLELANSQYVVVFTPAYLPLEEPAIELRNFTLISVRKSLGSEERKQLLNTTVAMKHEEKYIVGTMKIGLQNETLLVIVRTEILD